MSNVFEWLALVGGVWLVVLSIRYERRGERVLERRARVGAALLAFCLGLRLLVLEPYQGIGPSMLPTFPERSVLLVDKSVFGWRIPGTEWRVLGRQSPRPGDVVVSPSPVARTQEYLLKRVVATEGDEVRIQGSRVFVNGRPLESRRLATHAAPSGELWQANVLGRSHTVQLKPATSMPDQRTRVWTVPRGHVFLVGDNRDFSFDSRSFGPVRSSRVVGRVVGVWRGHGFARVDAAVTP